MCGCRSKNKVASNTNNTSQSKTSSNKTKTNSTKKSK